VASLLRTEFSHGVRISIGNDTRAAYAVVFHGTPTAAAAMACIPFNSMLLSQQHNATAYVIAQFMKILNEIV
jgi:hypothetical protein